MVKYLYNLFFKEIEKMRNDNYNMTSSLEDYLEAVFVISKQKNSVRLTDIAEYLGVSKPSVNRAINTLTQNGYLEHVTYGDIVITPQGETYAANVLRRHKLIKHFLIDTLGVDEKTAENDACQMEHVMSSSTIERLYDYLERQG
jgi:Mn-dependent DtxR family transcriptional regulator